MNNKSFISSTKIESLVWNSALMICMLLLIMLPDIYLLNAHPELGLRWLLSSVIYILPICVMIICAPWLWLQVVLITILSLISMVEVLSVFTYYNYINAISFPAFVYANSSELDDMVYYIVHYVSKHEILPMICYISCVILLLVYRKKKKFISKVSSYIGFIISIIVICVYIIGIDMVYAHSPYHMSREIVRAVKLGKTRRDNVYKNPNFTYNAEMKESNLNKTIVLAIGESLNYAHCSFNNQYHRQTTPQLSVESNTIFYSDYYASATYTEQSLPMILTRATPITFNINYREFPIQSAFKEVGYKTYVISNKNQIMNNGVDGYLLEGADSIIFVDTDSEVVRSLNQLVNREDNVFALLHFSGNHFFYGNYPDHYEKWKPNYNHNKESQSDSLFINAYDNSILYTDSLICACIANIKEVKKESIFMFTSDHGEYIDSHVGGHGLSCSPTKEEYHVPLMVWYSDEYAAAYPSKVANMIKHKDKPVCADHVFWSVLDMADIRIDSTVQQEGMSIFGDTLLPHKRTLLLPDGKTVMELESDI